MGLLEWIMGTQTTPDLATCEQRIQRGLDAYERGMAAYRDAGEALKAIRDSRLYRSTAKSFAEYCRARWHMDESKANRLIAAADVASNLMPTGMAPQTERVARPLTKLEPQEQLEAWAEAQELAAPSEPTSAHVAKAVAKRRKPSGKGRAKAIRLRVPGAIVIIEPGKGFVDAEKALFYALAKLGVVVEGAPTSELEQLERRGKAA